MDITLLIWLWVLLTASLTILCLIVGLGLFILIIVTLWFATSTLAVVIAGSTFCLWSFIISFFCLLPKVSSSSFYVIAFSVIPLLVSLFVRFIFVRLLKLTLSTFFWWSVVVLLRFTRLLLSRWVLSIFWICFLRLIGDRAMRTICWFCAQLNCVFNHGCDVLFIIFFRFGACKSLRFTTKRNTCLSFNFLQILYLIIGIIASFVELFGTFDMRCFCSLFLLTSLKLLFLRLFLLFNHLVVCFGLFVGIFHEDAL